jgi:hypothetical protein
LQYLLKRQKLYWVFKSSLSFTQGLFDLRIHDFEENRRK